MESHPFVNESYHFCVGKRSQEMTRWVMIGARGGIILKRRKNLFSSRTSESGSAHNYERPILSKPSDCAFCIITTDKCAGARFFSECTSQPQVRRRDLIYLGHLVQSIKLWASSSTSSRNCRSSEASESRYPLAAFSVYIIARTERAFHTRARIFPPFVTSLSLSLSFFFTGKGSGVQNMTFYACFGNLIGRRFIAISRPTMWRAGRGGWEGEGE